MGILKITYVQGPPGTPHKHDTCKSCTELPSLVQIESLIHLRSYVADFIVPALILNALEPLLASICSCLPSIAYFFRHVRLDGYLQVTSLLRSAMWSNASKNSEIDNPTLESEKTEHKQESVIDNGHV